MALSRAAYRGSHDRLSRWAGLALAASLACSPAPPATRRPPTRGPQVFLADARALGPAGVQRLSRAELAQTLRDVLGVSVDDALERLPAEASGTSFDNDHTQQVASPALVEGLRDLAETAAQRFAAAAPAVGCEPGPACLRALVGRLGHRLLRRPLSPQEVDELARPDGGFWPGVDFALRVLVQDPEFVYRLEVGTVVAGEPGVVRLADHELAARLSFVLTGGPPDDALHGAEELDTPEAVRAAAERLLSTPVAEAHWRRFFARWLSYETIPLAQPLAGELRREADALVSRFVLAPGASWPDLFRAGETFVGADLAAHYGLPSAPAVPSWLSWGGTGRSGILSTGAILSNGAGPSATSVVQRGAYVSRRLLCRPVPAPPPEASGLTLPKEDRGDRCKRELIREHAALPTCAACHRDLDGTGQGLEGYDGQGLARTEDESGCRVHPVGEVELSGAARATFSGPADLARVLLDSGTLSACFVTQLFSFVVGRPVEDTDRPTLDAISVRLATHGQRLSPLLVDLVASPAFRHRRPRIER